MELKEELSLFFVKREREKKKRKNRYMLLLASSRLNEDRTATHLGFKLHHLGPRTCSTWDPCVHNQ